MTDTSEPGTGSPTDALAGEALEVARRADRAADEAQIASNQLRDIAQEAVAVAATASGEETAGYPAGDVAPVADRNRDNTDQVGPS